MINREFSRLVREKRRAGIRQHYKSVMKFWQYDNYADCRKYGLLKSGTVGSVFQQYQLDIDQNIIQFVD